MKYFSWLWQNSCGIRWNTVVRIVTGIGQVVLGLLMVWFSKRFIDETIRTGTADDVLRMVELLVLTVMGGVVLRQVGYWLKTSANVRQSNALRLRIFGRLFHRQLFTGDELHSGDVSSRLAKDIDQVTKVTTDTLPEMLITGIKLCGAFLLMRWFDERLAWALLLLTPLAIVFGKLIAHRLRTMTLDIRQDESRIQMQVLTNFVTNAVKFTEKGHIRLGYRYENHGLYLYCEDTGKGIPLDKQQTVFERFVKLDEFIQGTGMGLAICKSIAERCEGEIGVISQGEGTCSTFWLWIPYERRLS